MNSLPFDIICPKHTDCETPISFITTILSANDALRFEQISNEFDKLRIKKVKDLARLTIEKASSIKLCGDSLMLLNRAIQIFSECLDFLQKFAIFEIQSGHFINTQQICEELKKHKPKDLNVILLNADLFFKCGNYGKSIDCLVIAKNINLNCFKVYNNLGLIHWLKSEIDVAKLYFSVSCQIEPFCIYAWMNYADVLVKTNDLKLAGLVYERVLLLDPTLLTARSEYGHLLLRLNEIKKARKQFKIVQKSVPFCQTNLNSLGNTYFMTAKFSKAILYYEKLLEVNPNMKMTLKYLGLSYLKESEFQKAYAVFQKILNVNPEDFDVLRYLAYVFYYENKLQLSIETFLKCLKLQPNNEDVNFELAVIYVRINNSEEAELHLKKCIKFNNQRKDVFKLLYKVYAKSDKYINASDACISLGDLYMESDDHENAKDAYISAIQFNPENAIGHWKVGLVMHKLGHYDMALIRYRKAIQLQPSFPNIYCDIAIIYEHEDNFEKALECYTMALQFQPDHLNTIINLSILKQKLGKLDDIVDIYHKILKVNISDAFDVHLNLANIFCKKNKNLDGALVHYENALTDDNKSVNIYIDMGSIFKELNMNKEALHCFYKAIQYDQNESDNVLRTYEVVLKLKPDFPKVYWELVQCLQKVCDWTDYDSHVIILKEIFNKQLNNDKVSFFVPHDLLMFPLSLELQTNIATKYANHCVEMFKNSIETSKPFIHPKSIISSNGKLRIGFVSIDFGKRPISTFMESLSKIYNYHIDVICYSISSYDNILPCFKNKLFKHHRDLSQLTTIDAAKFINSDGIHILVDLSGYTNGVQTEIFALRPAPIQVSWLGYPSTSVDTFFDYLITDKNISFPPELQSLCTEKLAYTNQTIFSGDHKRALSNLPQRQEVIDSTNNIIHHSIDLYGDDVNESVGSVKNVCIEEELPTFMKYYSRPKFNLPENVVVFCNFSKLYKIDPFTLRMWLTILNNVPNSVLWLLHFNDTAENNLRKYANDLSFDTSRIIFADFIPINQHMNRIQLADVYLDTHLHNGHRSCLDALWAGVPVVTLPGDTYTSRVTASQLTTLGITNTIAQNEENFIEIATQLALNKIFLENMKKNIWKCKMHSVLFDMDVYTKEIILIFKNMWYYYLFVHDLDM